MNVSVCELSITVAGNRKLLSDVNCLVKAGFRPMVRMVAAGIPSRWSLEKGVLFH